MFQHTYEKFLKELVIYKNVPISQQVFERSGKKTYWDNREPQHISPHVGKPNIPEKSTRYNH
jgi:hypothetical protein